MERRVRAHQQALETRDRRADRRTATSLDAQDWAPPLPIENTQSSLTIPCPGLTTGQQYDGYYPSFMSPGAAAGHTKLTGKAFFLNGCDTGVRTFMARSFTITVQQ